MSKTLASEHIPGAKYFHNDLSTLACFSKVDHGRETSCGHSDSGGAPITLQEKRNKVKALHLRNPILYFFVQILFYSLLINQIYLLFLFLSFSCFLSLLCFSLFLLLFSSLFLSHPQLSYLDLIKLDFSKHPQYYIKISIKETIQTMFIDFVDFFKGAFSRTFDI